MNDLNEFLVGQSFKILVVYSTAVIQCQCDAKTVIPLHGKERVSICPACHKAFAIAGSGQIHVGEVILPTPAELVGQ